MSKLSLLILADSILAIGVGYMIGQSEPRRESGRAVSTPTHAAAPANNKAAGGGRNGSSPRSTVSGLIVPPFPAAFVTRPPTVRAGGDGRAIERAFAAGANIRGVGYYGFKTDDLALPSHSLNVSGIVHPDVGGINPESTGDRKRPTAPAVSTTRRMLVTAYCHCEKCCGKKPDHPAYGITASGKPVSENQGRFVAAPADIRFGTSVSVPGYWNGLFVPVLDRGGAIKGDRLDLYFPTHSEALAWGVQHLNITIYERITNVRKHRTPFAKIDKD